MRDGLVVAIIIIASVSVGGIFYIYGGSAFTSTPSTTQSADADGITILAQGVRAPSVDQRVNYRITSVEDLTALWEMVYSNSGPTIPIIDFSHKEVLAVFDGSHSSGGYSVTVKYVKDANGKRVVGITHGEPDSTCAPTGNASSPFIIVSVDKTALPLTHEEHIEIKPCR